MLVLNKNIMKNKISVGMRKQIIANVVADAEKDNNYASYYGSIMRGISAPLTGTDIMNATTDYCDQWCNNGWESRWTNFGVSLYNTMVSIARAYDKALAEIRA